MDTIKNQFPSLNDLILSTLTQEEEIDSLEEMEELNDKRTPTIKDQLNKEGVIHCLNKF